jgi:transketolase
VALLDTLSGWTVHVPGHPDEVAAALQLAMAASGRVYVRLSERTNARPRRTGWALDVVRRSADAAAPVVLAVGPMLDATLEAVQGLDATVAWTGTPRPFDGKGLRALAGDVAQVVLVEPYLAGTSAPYVAEALRAVPHRLLALGVPRTELRRYGTPADHDRAYDLDAAGLRRSITGFLDSHRGRRPEDA